MSLSDVHSLCGVCLEWQRVRPLRRWKAGAQQLINPVDIKWMTELVANKCNGRLLVGYFMMPVYGAVELNSFFLWK